MLKPNKTFKLSKTTKRMLCSIVNTEQRNQYKRMMIDAELCAAIVPKTIKKESRPGSNYNTTSTSATAAE
jgi:hypothetical protein